MAALDHNTRMIRARNYRLAFAMQNRAHTTLDNPATDRLIAEVMAEEPPYDGTTPVYEAVEATGQRILERMREHPTR